MIAGVGPRHFEGAGGKVGGQDPRRGQLASEGDGDAARARADVDDPGIGGQVQAEGRFDQVLGLRPRYEHPRVDPEVPAVELPAAEQIGHGLSPGAPIEQGLIPLRRGW